MIVYVHVFSKGVDTSAGGCRLAIHLHHGVLQWGVHIQRDVGLLLVGDVPRRDVILILW